MEQNLFERLDPKIKELIEKDAIEFPTSSRLITDELKSTFYLSDLKYRYIVQLEGYVNINKIDIKGSLWNLFGELKIENI